MRNTVKESNKPPVQDEFQRNVLLSILFHVILFALLVVRTVFFPSEPIQYERAIRVDLVALPDKVQTQQPAPPRPQSTPAPVVEKKPEPPPPKPKPPPPEKPKVDLSKKRVDQAKRQQEQALERLQALERVKQQQAQRPEPPPQPVEYKGNVLSPGTALTGLNKLQHEAYIDEIDSHVKRHWNLPEWLANGNFRAHVVIKINHRGFVTSIEFRVSSGNSIFDERVVATIQQASPFPEPPQKFVDILEVNGIELRFPD